VVEFSRERAGRAKSWIHERALEFEIIFEMELSVKIRCGHCGNTAPMEVLRWINRTEHFEDHGIEWNTGFLYELLECFPCGKVVLRRISVHTGLDPGGIDSPLDVLYPSGTDTPSGLPKRVENAYDAALAVKAIDPNAFAVWLGRVLDAVCCCTLCRRVSRASDTTVSWPIATAPAG
jgi:hypothetical protein